MPRTGAGVYSKPAGTTAVSGTTIESAKYNSTIDDLVTDANTARPIVAGGTGSTTASAARAALGLAIGSDIQAYDAGLLSIAALTTAADKMPYTTALDTYALADLTAFARTLLDDADAATARTTLGVYSTAGVDSAISTAVGAVQSAPVFVLEHREAGGTAGGAASTSWSQRTLNTTVRNVSSAVSLTTNQFTPAADCWVEFGGMIYQRAGTCRIYNVTDAVQVAVSPTANANTNGTNVLLMGGCVLSGGKTYELQDIVAATVDGNDRGIAGSLAAEVYARIVAWSA